MSKYRKSANTKRSRKKFTKTAITTRQNVKNFGMTGDRGGTRLTKP